MKRIYSLIVAVALLPLLAMAQPQRAPQLTGGGTWDDPYLITSGADLQVLSQATNEEGCEFEGAYFQFTDDIDLGVIDFEPISGQAEHPFRGVLDGGQHRIVNWHFSGQETTEVIDYRPAALIVYVGEGGAVQNLTIDSSCTLEAGGNFAPLVYSLAGSMHRCFNRADVTAEHDVSGIVCRVQPTGQVGGCFNEGRIAVQYGYVGGIAARNLGSLSLCQNTGVITGGEYGYVGGLVGENHGQIGNCLSNGLLKGKHVIGGLSADAWKGSVMTGSLCTAVIIPAGDNLNQVGAIVGSVSNAEMVTFSGVVYDSQITIYNNNGNKGITAQTTQKLVDNIWSGSKAWTQCPGMYPQIWQFYQEPSARLAAAPVIFAETDTRLTMSAPAKLYSDLTDSMWWTLDGDPEFYLDDESRLTFREADRSLSTTLTANHSGYTKEIPVVTVAPLKADIEQVNLIINMILQVPTEEIAGFDADVNHDNTVDVDDINILINRILAQ